MRGEQGVFGRALGVSGKVAGTIVLLATVPAVAGCLGGGGHRNSKAGPPTLGALQAQAVQLGGSPPNVGSVPGSPAAKASHGKGVGRQAKLAHRKVCPKGQAKRMQCTSQVATDKNGPLTFPKPDAYSLPGSFGTV